MKTKRLSCLKAAYTFVVTILPCINILTARGFLENDNIDIQSRSLHVPSLDELRAVLTEELSKNYAEVSVEIVDCPDLQKPPFSLAASGLGGNPGILDIGGPRAHSFMSNNPYNLDTIASRTGAHDKRFIIGAAQGPTSYTTGKSELVVNIVLNSPESYPGSIAAVTNDKNDKYYLVRLPGNETGISFVGNLLISEGKPGKVLQVHVKKRIGSISAFPDSMQQALAKHYPRKLVGMGGTFVSKSGKVKHHLLSSPETGSHFLFYNMSAPLISTGVFMSAQTDLQLAFYHFHSFSDHNDGGHYRNDVTPDEIEYIGYFTPGEVVWRVVRQKADFPEVPDSLSGPNDWNANF